MHRPRAPADLTEAEAEVWRSVVAVKSPDWFPADCWPLLRQYCRHAVTADTLEQSLVAIGPVTRADLDEYGKVLKMRLAETACLAMLATRMRLTQQARMQSDTAGRKTRDAGGGEDKPWLTEA